MRFLEIMPATALSCHLSVLLSRWDEAVLHAGFQHGGLPPSTPAGAAYMLTKKCWTLCGE